MLNMTKKMDTLKTVLHEAAYNLFLQYHGFVVMFLALLLWFSIISQIMLFFLISNGDTMLDTFFSVFLASYYST